MRECRSARQIFCIIACAVIAIGILGFSAMARAQQCSFTASPTVVEAGHSGGAYTINFTASGSTCNWIMSSSDDWITVPAANRGTGSGTVTVTVKPNTGTAARQGRIALNRQYIWVNQPQQPPCTYTVSPSSINRPASGGGTSIQITASDKSCPWTIEGTAWLSTPFLIVLFLPE